LTTLGFNSGTLPDGDTLRIFELQSRKSGSGLKMDGVVGHWKLHEIWGKTKKEPSIASGKFLRVLKALLTIEDAAGGLLAISNSVTFGPLKLCFIGSGRLKQKRPLLMFWFTRLEICLGARVLFTLPLPEPKAGKEPFFALIARDNTPAGVAWLAARGRGGGLALWVREDGEKPYGGSGIGEKVST
jgi:hypothetical protein